MFLTIGNSVLVLALALLCSHGVSSQRSEFSGSQLITDEWPDWLRQQEKFKLPAQEWLQERVKSTRASLRNEVPKFSKTIWLIELKPEVSVEEFHSEARDIGILYEERVKFNGELFHGLSISVSEDDAEDSDAFFQKVSKIVGANTVLKAYPSSRFQRPQAKVNAAMKSDLSEYRFNGAEFPALAGWTGVRDTHEKLNVWGEGVKVGIIDTGTDYHHPALGGCFGKEGCKVRYGYDVVGDYYNSTVAPQPDNDPMDCAGHGTHVAGIIAAYDPDSPLRGVAPNVTIGSYRVFGCEGDSGNDVIIAAAEHAVRDGMDVINLSLGGGAAWPEDPLTLALNKASMRGIIVAIAAGNDGTEGMYMVGAPSGGPYVTSVASIDNSWIFGNTMVVLDKETGISKTIEFVPETKNFGDNKYWQDQSIVLTHSYKPTDLPENDACTKFKSSANFTGKVVLIREGGCLLDDKVINAQNSGAIAVIIYNEMYYASIIAATVMDSRIKIPSIGISSSDGHWIVKHLKFADLHIQWDKRETPVKNPTRKAVSDFSSLGLGPRLEMKPEISSPGGYIFSTYLTNDVPYVTMSGTSMAAPYITGCYALLLSGKPWLRNMKPELVPKFAKVLLQNGATPNLVRGFDPAVADLLSSPVNQGAGVVDIYASILSSTVVTPSRLALGDLPPPQHGELKSAKTVLVKIYNAANKVQRYSLYNERTAVVDGTDAGTPKYFPPSTKAGTKVRVKISDKEVVVAPNRTVSVSIEISLPAKAYRVNPFGWLLGGFIKIKTLDSKQPEISVPYVAFKGLFSRMRVLDTSNNVYPCIYSVAKEKSFINPMGINGSSSMPFGDSVRPVVTFTFRNLSVSNDLYGEDSSLTTLDMPSIYYRMEFPSPKVTISLLSAQNGTLIGRIATEKLLGRNYNSPFSGLYVYGIDWPGNVTVAHSEGFKKSSYNVPNGLYVIEIAAEVPIKSNTGPEIWYSPVFEIKRQKK